MGKNRHRHTKKPLIKKKTKKQTNNKKQTHKTAVSIKFWRKAERIWDFSYFYSSATYFNYQTTLYHNHSVITISLIHISSMCGKADMGATKAFCLHNTLSHYTLETPLSIVVLVRSNKNSVRPAKLSFWSWSCLLFCAWQGKDITGQVLLLVEAAFQLDKAHHQTYSTSCLDSDIPLQEDYTCQSSLKSSNEILPFRRLVNAKLDFFLSPSPANKISSTMHNT